MKNRMRYILGLLILVIVYEVYLVVYYKYQDFRVNTYMRNLEAENARISERIEKKKEYYASVQTNAYLDRIMKSSQNRKNPGEEVLFLVDEKEVSDYKKLNTDEAIMGEKKMQSPTYGMSNSEKWRYYLLGEVN